MLIAHLNTCVALRCCSVLEHATTQRSRPQRSPSFHQIWNIKLKWVDIAHRQLISLFYLPTFAFLQPTSQMSSLLPREMGWHCASSTHFTAKPACAALVLILCHSTSTESDTTNPLPDYIHWGIVASPTRTLLCAVASSHHELSAGRQRLQTQT